MLKRGRPRKRAFQRHSAVHRTQSWYYTHVSPTGIAATYRSCTGEAPLGSAPPCASVDLGAAQAPRRTRKGHDEENTYCPSARPTFRVAPLRHSLRGMPRTFRGEPGSERTEFVLFFNILTYADNGRKPHLFGVASSFSVTVTIPVLRQDGKFTSPQIATTKGFFFIRRRVQHGIVHSHST